ncbi:MAG: helix-turn-helix transcriptional regulator [Clostridia bacterium]|nr:helix-turn-helix transcriptional regulator [Clostridia bacterium]
MKIVEISELSELDRLDVSSLFAMNQTWREGYTFHMDHPREQSAFLWFCGCSGRFLTEDGEAVPVLRGALVYIPEGAQYKLSFFDCEAVPTNILVELCLSDGEKFVLSNRVKVLDPCLENPRIIALLGRLVSEYATPSRPMLKLRRDAYDLLNLICEAERQANMSRRGFRTVEKGIEYLEKDEGQELSVDEIARMCFVTPAYFRRLFREYSGMSPREYRTRRRIERAKDMMERTELSVESLSELLGYSDPSYFCRVFKKETGMSPSEYQKKISKQ